MRYLFKNLKSFIQTEKTIFFLVLLCVVTSSFIINFSYGLYQNFNVIKEETENEEFVEIVVEINDSKQVTKNKMKNCIFSISGETNDAIDMYLVSPSIKASSNADLWNTMDCRFTIRDNHLYPCEIFYSNLQEYGNWDIGEYFSVQNEVNGDLVAIAKKVDKSAPDYCTTTLITTRTEKNRRWIEIQGKEYEVIGYHKFGEAPYVPFESLDDNTEFENLMIVHFEKTITWSQYNEVREMFEQSFGNAVTVSDLDISESENYYLYNTIIVISILIALLAAINFAVLYNYILFKRTKKLAVFRICGCTKTKAFTMFISECMMLMIPLFVVTTIIYDRLVLPKLGEHFEYIESAYSMKLYLLIFMIYIVTSVIVLSFMISGFLSKSIREAKEEK